MRWIEEQGTAAPDPLVIASELLPWSPVDSWIARYLQPNGEIIALRLIIVSYRLPSEKSERLMERFRALREAGHLTLLSSPDDLLMRYEASRAFRESARVHAPRISWRLFHPEELPV